MSRRTLAGLSGWLPALLMLSMLAGCGGGNGAAVPHVGDSDAPPVEEAAFAVGAITEGDALPGAAVSLKALAASDHDIVTYDWAQTGGPPVSLSDARSETAYFRVPPLGDDTELRFRLTARSGDGDEVSYEVRVLARPHKWRDLHVVDADVRNDFVVFRADKDLDKRIELYRANLDGSGIVLLNDRLVPGGNVHRFQISPDGDYVAYYADQDVDDVFELYVAESDGSDRNKVSGPLVGGGNVTDEFEWAPDSSRIAYRADQRADEVFELFTVFPDGSDNERVSGDMAPGGNVVAGGFAWSPDSNSLAYRADQLADGRFELFTSDAEGDGNERVSGLLIAGGGVLGHFAWAPDAAQIAYIADQRALGAFELFVVAPDGTGNTRVSGPLVDDGGVIDFAWSPDSSALAYRADQIRDELLELFSVLRDGSGNTLLSTLPTSGEVRAYAWAPDGSAVAYTADQRSDDVFELFVSGPAGQSNTRVSGPLLPDGDVSRFAWSPTGEHLAYQADQSTDGLEELFTSAPDGSANVQVSGPLVAGGRVFGEWQWSLDGQWLAYRADQLTDEVIELFTASPDGSANPLVSGAMTASGDVVALSGPPFRFSPDSANLVYAADQLENQRFELFVTAPDGSTANANVSGPLTEGGDVYDFALSSRRSGVAALPRVLLVAAEFDERTVDVQTKLQATGRFSSVGTFPARTATPTLDQLRDYDAVLVWSDFLFADRAAMGNVLADYVDGGGGVVNAIFGTASSNLFGRFIDDGYNVLIPSGVISGGSQSLVAVQAAHPLLTGVGSFSGGTSSIRQTTMIVADATMVATWTDGQPLIATREINGVRRVDLGLYPPSSDTIAGFWDAATDGDIIMANALLYVMNRL